jgi:GGDEF domain-containing protein
MLLPEAQVDPESLERRLSQHISRGIGKDRLVDFPVTLSIGWARWNPGGSISVEEALAEADRHMYENKRKHSAINEGKV